MAVNDKYKQICQECWKALEPLGVARGPYLEGMPDVIVRLILKLEAHEDAVRKIKETLLTK